MKKTLTAMLLTGALLLPTPTLANSPYKDVSNYTHTHIVNRIVSSHIMEPISTTHFGISQPVTRGDVAAYIQNAYKLYAVRPAKQFVDVPASHPQAAAIQALYRAGIVDGSSTTEKFRPDDKITRAHVAKIFTNLLKLTPQTTNAFSDVALSNPNNTHIGALVQKGIVTGYPNGQFRPNAPVSRMQLATFIYRSLYGMEPQKPVAVKRITSNFDYAPTKLKAANYTDLPRSDYRHHFYTQFMSNGNNIVKEFGLIYDVYEEWIYVGQDGTDAWGYYMDLRGLEDGKPQERMREMYGTHYHHTLTAYFEDRVYVNNVLFKDVVKVAEKELYTVDSDGAIMSPEYDGVHTIYYFKKGYGLLKVTNGEGDSLFEIGSYTLR